MPFPDQPAGLKHHLALFDHVMLALLVCLTDSHVFAAEQIRAYILALNISLPASLFAYVQKSIFILLSHSLIEVLSLLFSNELAFGLKLAREGYAKPYSANQLHVHNEANLPVSTEVDSKAGCKEVEVLRHSIH